MLKTSQQIVEIKQKRVFETLLCETYKPSQFKINPKKSKWLITLIWFICCINDVYFYRKTVGNIKVIINTRLLTTILIRSVTNY